MPLTQHIPKIAKKTNFLMGLLILVFFLKGLLLTNVLPIFEGFDEARHYNTIQYLAEPEKKDWPITSQPESDEGDVVQRYHYTEEIKETAARIRCVGGENFGCKLYKTTEFSESYFGKDEKEIDSRPWKQYNTENRLNFSFPNIAVRGKSLYHQLGSHIEKILSESSILVRFYAFRIISVLLGTLTILVFFLILNNLGFSSKHSLFITAIISFQPRFSAYYSFINYDALTIFLFALFILGGVLGLRRGLDWKNFSLMFFSFLIGYWTKPTALILIPIFIAFLAFHFYQKYFKRKRERHYLFFVALAITAAVTLLFLRKFLPSGMSISATMLSLFEFASESLTIGKIDLTAQTYWDVQKWTNGWLMSNITPIVWTIQALAAIGLILFFTRKDTPNFLPTKKQALFLLVFLAAFHLGVRMADWKYFTLSGNLQIQAPGRYFFPMIVPHFALIFIGLGALLKKEKYFDHALVSGLLLMFLFFMYYLFNVLIFRFYL